MGTCQKVSSSGEVFTLFFTVASPFSNFHPARFKALTSDGCQREFNCVEQYYMFYKAKSADDDEIARKVMEQRNPRAIKKLGQEIKGFSAERWNLLSPAVMRNALIEKYSQNKELRKLLFLTSGTTLVEASPTDYVWGIGLPMDHPNAGEKSCWRGKNQLGQIMTLVREELWAQERFEEDRLFAETTKTRDGYFAMYFSVAKARKTMGGMLVNPSFSLDESRKRPRLSLEVDVTTGKRRKIEAPSEVNGSRRSRSRSTSIPKNETLHARPNSTVEPAPVIGLQMSERHRSRSKSPHKNETLRARPNSTVEPPPAQVSGRLDERRRCSRSKSPRRNGNRKGRSRSRSIQKNVDAKRHPRRRTPSVSQSRSSSRERDDRRRHTKKKKEKHKKERNHEKKRHHHKKRRSRHESSSRSSESESSDDEKERRSRRRKHDRDDQRKSHRSERKRDSKDKPKTEEKKETMELDDRERERDLPSAYSKGNDRAVCEAEWAKRHTEKYEDMIDRRKRKLRAVAVERKRSTENSLSHLKSPSQSKDNNRLV